MHCVDEVTVQHADSPGTVHNWPRTIDSLTGPVGRYLNAWIPGREGEIEQDIRTRCEGD